MARSPSGIRTGAEPDVDNYHLAPHAGHNTHEMVTGTRQPETKPGDVRRRPQERAKSRVDEWMEVDFRFGGSRIKRKAVALILLGACPRRHA